jgi:glycosyltransferase involved in cell wall biosynthesis
MKVSVIVPVYNVAAYLQTCLVSLGAQTYEDYEVLLIDDCSTDHSAALCQAWVTTHAQFKLLQQTTNQGVSAARNRGLAEMTGDYVCFVDSDDWCEPDYLAHLEKVMTSTQADLVNCGFFSDPPHLAEYLGQQQHELSQGEYLQDVLKLTGDVRGYLWNKIYRADLIKTHDLSFDTDLKIMEDQLFNVQYGLLARKFVYDSKPLYHYITRENSAINVTLSYDKVEAELKAQAKIQQVLFTAQLTKTENQPILERQRKLQAKLKAEAKQWQKKMDENE